MQVELNLDTAHMDSSRTFTLKMFGKDTELSLYVISILLSALDLLGMLVFLAFVMYLRLSQQKQKLTIDKRTKTAADYSVMVTGIVGKKLDIEALRKHFEVYGKVEAVSVATYNEVFLTCKQKVAEILKSQCLVIYIVYVLGRLLLRILKVAEINEKNAIVEAKVAKAQQMAKEKGKPPPLFWISDADFGEQGLRGEGRRILTTRKSAHIPTVRELELNHKTRDKLKEDLDTLGHQCDDCYAAFITFANEKDRRKCLDSVSFRDYIPCIGNTSRGPQMKNAIIQEAPEVTNVSWENLPYGLGNKTLRTCGIWFCALVLLAASFFINLVAQVYQRYHPLQSCPPAVFESKLETVSQDYFYNRSPDAWGPGVRGKGLGLLLSDGVFFDKFGVCQGGGCTGQKCDGDEECISVEGTGKCRVYDLSCSYRAQMQRAEQEQPISELSQADRANLISERFLEKPSGSPKKSSKSSFVVGQSSGSSDTDEEEEKPELLKWNQMGLPPVCRKDLYVLDESVAVRVDVLERPVLNYTYDLVNYTTQHTDLGQLKRDVCLSNLPSLSECKPAPDNCTRWPGCNYSAWPACQELSNVNKTQCVEELTIAFMVENATAGTFTWQTETISSPSFVQAQRCNSSMLSAGNVTCQTKLKVTYETRVRTFRPFPVYSERVCDRYKRQCSNCFCIESISSFWVVWLFSLSESYSALCSKQLGQILEEYSIFVGAAVSVSAVNAVLKMLLRAFAGFEKGYTKSETEKSIAVRIFLAQFFNTALVPLLVYARIQSLSEEQCRGGTGVFDPANAVATFGFNGMPCNVNEKAINVTSQKRQPVCSFGGGECLPGVPVWFPIFTGEFTDFQSLWYSTVGTSILITVRFRPAHLPYYRKSLPILCLLGFCRTYCFLCGS